MANRGYKLQEFVAHSTSVKCLRLGKKVPRRLLTGGEDHRVNVWAIGKSSSLVSLVGHSTSVECVAFDSTEDLVLAGASSGSVKLWDLEKSKLLRNFTGHRSKCTAIDFHPFGELFASSSVDKELKIWDLRKKGCIQTYKGHSLAINTIKFTPDGRWVVSGGLDNIVKVWDLTAGKLMHDFSFHEGPTRSIEFHPQEFLLATGSDDRTVKFWDLETFEFIGSTRVEAAGVRAMSFHPGGRTLLCGYDDNLKVFSWEPVISHDSVDMEWSTLGDLCIQDKRLIGCSYYRNSVGIWAADVSLLKPYGRTNSILDDNDPVELKSDLQGSDSLSDVDSKEIKNIYVDCEKPVNPKNTGGRRLPKIKKPVDHKELNNLPFKKSSSAVTLSPKPVEHLTTKSFNVSRGTSGVKDFDNIRREPISPGRGRNRVPHTPFHTRRASDGKFHMKRSPLTESRSLNSSTGSIFDGLASDTSSRCSLEEKCPIMNNAEDKSKQDPSPLVHSNVKTVGDSLDWKKPTTKLINGKFDTKGSTLTESRSLNSSTGSIFDGLASDTSSRGSLEDKCPTMNNVEDKIKQDPSPLAHSNVMTVDDSLDWKKPTTKVINGVSVAHGRTRSLVAKFERWEKPVTREDQIVDSNISSEVLADRIKISTMVSEEPQISGRDSSSPSDENIIEDLMQSHDTVLSGLQSRLTKLQMVRRFWEESDFKGAINTMKKFPDYSVQADVIGVFMDKIEIINLDLFCCLLPVLVNLVNSKTERHANMSLEMLLKLVAIYGQMISSTISATPSVGVDLHREERIDCCKQSFSQLQKLKRALPEITRRSALLGKLGMELNLILQLHNIS